MGIGGWAEDLGIRLRVGLGVETDDKASPGVLPAAGRLVRGRAGGRAGSGGGEERSPEVVDLVDDDDDETAADAAAAGSDQGIILLLMCCTGFSPKGRAKLRVFCVVIYIVETTLLIPSMTRKPSTMSA